MRAHYFEHRVTEEGLLEGFKWKLRGRIKFEFHRLPRARFIEIWSVAAGLVEVKQSNISFMY